MVNGCAGSPVRFCDVSQQGLFAQHAGAHAFWLGTFTNTHVGEAEPPDAIVTAATSTRENVILLNINLTSSMKKAAGRVTRGFLGTMNKKRSILRNSCPTCARYGLRCDQQELISGHLPHSQLFPQLHSLPLFIGQFLPVFLQFGLSAANAVVHMAATRIDNKIFA